jgi:hypothetical protein
MTFSLVTEKLARALQPFPTIYLVARAFESLFAIANDNHESF